MFVVKLEKHVADKNRQLIPQWSAFTYANMYGVKFEQVSQRNCLFCGKLSEKPTLLSDRGHLWKDTQRTFKEMDTSEKTFFVFWNLKQTFLEFDWFYEILAIKVKL